jgi:ABC-type transport system involved in multi-copper enzyme maturation permease subunit
MTTVDSPAIARDTHTRVNPVWQVQAELMKIRTTRLWWFFFVGILLVSAVALLRNGAAHHYELFPPLDQYPENERAQAAAQAVQSATDAGHAAIAADMLTSGQFLGVLLAMLLGVLSTTGEYAHKTAASTFLTNPRRGAVIVAKLAAAVMVAALLWVISTVLDFFVTPFYLSSQHIHMSLATWVPVRSVLLNLLAYAMWAIFGVGLGALFQSQVGAVVAGVGVYLGGAGAVLLIFNLIYQAYHHTWVLGAPVIAPAVASLVMITPGRAFDHAPPQWAGLLVMVGYVLTFGIAGLLRTRRREI